MAKVLLFFINIVYELLLLKKKKKKKKNYSNTCSNKPLVPLQLTSSSSTIPLHLLLLHNIPMQLTPLISQELLLLQVQLEEFQQKKRLTWCSYLVPLSKQLQQLVPVIICTARKNKLCVQLMLFTIMEILYYNLGTLTVIFIGTGEFNIAPNSFNSYTILIQFMYSWAILLALHMYHSHWRANAEITHVFSKGVQVFVCGFFD
jgi:hypothetical protein